MSNTIPDASTVPTSSPVSGNSTTASQSKEQQVPQTVDWVKYYVLVSLGADLSNSNPVLGQTRTNQYGNLQSFPDYQVIEVDQTNSDKQAWEAYLNQGVSTPLVVNNGHLELGYPIVTSPSPEVILQERMTSLMSAVQRYGWGVFTDYPTNAQNYGKELAALQSKSPLSSTDIPPIPENLVDYLN